jgi:SAM-dependent methyltransferase
LPYVLPDSFRSSERFALVLAFGQLSVLEACSVLSQLKRVDTACERVAVVDMERSASRSLPRLAGVHKFAPLLAEFEGEEGSLKALAEALSDELEEVRRLAVSGYEVPEDDYEGIVRALLDAVSEAGFKKVRLLRPKGNELLSEQMLSREALDVLAFPYGQGYGLGPTTWVSDVASIKRRALDKPAPRSEISLSPRLARLLVNLSGLAPGQLLLDPFCGSGTILTEGLSKSLDCVGLDTSQNRLRDARKNLVWARRNGARGTFRLELGDARGIQDTLQVEAGGIVTEPVLLPRLDYRPNTAAAGELVAQAGDIYASALASMARVLRPGGRIVIVVPVITTTQDEEVVLTLEGGRLGLREYQPGPIRFQYPVRLSFESTRWVRRAVYVFESRA